MRVWHDRVELWNPGTLPPNFTIETLFSQHESQPRNKLIAKTFYLAGFIENWGRGYEKICKAFDDEHLTTPTFEQVRGGFQATILRERFAEMNGTPAIEGSKKECGEKSSKKSEVILIDFLRCTPDATINDTHLATGLSISGVRKILDRLKQQGLIRRVGPDKGGRWEVITPPPVEK